MYEVHVTVEIPDTVTEMRWIVFANENKWKPIRAINERGDNSIQVMMSYYIHKESEKDGLVELNRIADFIQDNGFKVVRKKIEAMSQNQNYQTVVLDDSNGIYWELHLKIELDSLSELDRLIHWRITSTLGLENNIGISMSSYGQSKYPIVTLRCHTGGRSEFYNLRDILISNLHDHSFKVASKMQQECSIFDSYPEEDDGWFN